MTRVLFATFLCGTLSLLAQDPVKVDSKHYKVELDNAQVRVLRIKYGPREKSVMHDHPASVVIPLSDAHTKFTMPDGKIEEMNLKAGQPQFIDAGKHLPENLSDKPFEAILVELKGRGAAPAKKEAAKKDPSKKEK